VFNSIARKTLNNYCKKYPDAAVALQKWYHEFRKQDFANVNQVKEVYKSVSAVADNRIVFNIRGNKFRLVVRINFQFKAAQIKWFGTLTEYDKLDVTKIKFKKDGS
jgi:mRNA interferase HigB